MLRILVNLSAVLAALFVLGTAAELPAADAQYEARALWVTRWDYTTPADIQQIVKNAAACNFNVILFQVRGEATAFYRSSYEPWAWELTSKTPATTGQDPGWDPLATAVAYAHAAGLEIHAYMNVLPVWKQETEPPASANHLLTTHSDWLMHNRKGEPMPIEGFYTFLNPAHPKVKRHLINVFAEVISNYNIDGIHLDYIRYPSEYQNGDLSYDPVSLALFKNMGYESPQEAPNAWRQFKTEQINDLVKRLYVTVKSIKPNVMVSAACIASRDNALKTQCQDSLAWLNGGYMDCLMPMNYTADSELFLNRLNPFIQQRQRGLLYMGIQANRGEDALRAQIDYIRESGMHGVSVFCYEDFFKEHQANGLAAILKKEFFSSPARVTGRKYPES